jgi:hypothetical protein
MQHILEGFNINDNFWKQNPQLRSISPYSSLYKKDKTRNKEFSSIQMWAIWMFADVSTKNKFRRFNEEERKKEIESEYLTKKHKWEDLEEGIEAWPKLIMTYKQRLFASWKKKMEERDKFISNTEYNESSYIMLDKMMESTDKMWSRLQAIENDMIEEEEKGGTTKGGRPESAIEKGQFFEPDDE